MEELKIRQKAEDMIKYGYICLRQFPKSEKHTLAAQVKICMIDLLRLIIACNKKFSKRTAMQEIESFLRSRLRLEYNFKTDIFPASRGTDFLGYRIWPTHRLLRKSSTKRMRKKLKSFEKRWRRGAITLDEITQSIASWIGHTRHCDAYFLRRALFNHFRLVKSWAKS